MASTDLTSEETITTPWWFVLIEGVALIVVGLLLLAQPNMSAAIIVQILGIYWLIMGIIRFVSIFVDSAQWGWKLLGGVLGIIAGIIVIQHPLWSTVVLERTVILILGLTGITIGIVSLIQAFQGAGWGSGILGAISIVLGLVLLANYWKLAFSLPVTLGILAIVGGIAAIFGAFRFRRDTEQLAAAAVPEAVAEVVETEAEEPAVVVAEAVVVEEVVQEVIEEPPVEMPLVIEEVVLEEAAPEEAPPDEAPALEHHAMQFVEGIGPAYAEKLGAAGINSTESLLERGSTPAGRSQLAEVTGISHKLILTWVNHADLMRIKGVGSQFADLLEEAGVDTVPDLARRNAANLYEKIVAINEEKHLVRHLPSSAEVEKWVDEANTLPRIVQY